VDYPEDRAHFFALTRRHVVIMGRRTWAERGEPLAERTNIVVSRTLSSPDPAVRVVPTLDEALEVAWAIDDEPFVIGGVRLFEEALLRATRLYVTDIPGEPEGDTVFLFDRSRFGVVEERQSPNGLRFVVLEPMNAAGRG
jgi:dihydrofolate reductase